MRRRMRRGLFAAAAALLLSEVAGCASDSWSAAADVNPSEWAAGAGILFPNADSLARYDVTLFLRCNDRFGEDTLTLRIATTTPDSLRFEEFFRITSPRTNGPAAIAREIAVPYRRRVRFAREGDYRMTIAPTRPVRGIEAVGIGTSDSQ